MDREVHRPDCGGARSGKIKPRQETKLPTKSERLTGPIRGPVGRFLLALLIPNQHLGHSAARLPGMLAKEAITLTPANWLKARSAKVVAKVA